MGLDAIVRCNCWEAGLTTPSPFPGRIRPDEDDYLALDLPYEGNEAAHQQFEAWRADACMHPDMEYASERISNWGGYHAFLSALDAADWLHFPTLHATLPTANGGITTPAEAAACLRELGTFRVLCDRNRMAALVNTATGHTLDEAPLSGRILVFGAGGLDIGFDAEGLFIVEAASHPDDPGFRAVDSLLPPVRAALNPTAPAPTPITTPARERFRARRVAQTQIGGDLPPAGTGRIEYEDLDTGRRFRCTQGIAGAQIPWPGGALRNESGQVRWSYPATLHVEVRRSGAADFAYILDPLTRIFEAAVTINRPVQWC